jgi:hypothetical protein
MVWLGVLPALLARGVMGRIHALLLLSILVLVPLLLSLTATPDRRGLHPPAYRAAWALFPLASGAATLSVVAFLPGSTAAVLAAPWLLFTLAVAVFGLGRLVPRGPAGAPEETCLDAGLIYLAVGGGWLALSRAGASPAGFGEPIVTLTAVHFHHAGFVAPIVAGLSGRALLARGASRRAFDAVAAGIVLGMPLVAAGIAASPALEIAGVVVFATSLAALSALVLFRLLPGVEARLPRVLLTVSAASLAMAMVLAVAYGAGEFAGLVLVPVPTMVQLHGWTNAVGFGLTAGIAWSLLRPPARARPPGVPFSALRSTGRVGPDFFHRIGAVPRLEGAPRGLVDDMSVYRRADLDPAALHAAVRRFYEDTAAHGLVVRPDWRSGFRLAGRLYRLASARVGQMNLPATPQGRAERISSAIFRLDDDQDGRRNVRAWVRTYAESGAAVYVAAYANHSHGDETYMNIAFPLPGGSLTSVLRLEMGAGGGLLLTSRPAPGGLGDEGVYFANPLLPVRLPIDETIRVWPRNAEGCPVGDEGSCPDATVVARHDIWIFGLRFLTLDYWVFPLA